MTSPAVLTQLRQAVAWIYNLVRDFNTEGAETNNVLKRQSDGAWRPGTVALSETTGTISDTQHGVRTLANAHDHADLSNVTSFQHHGGNAHTGTIQGDTEANRPSAGTAGRMFYATDSQRLYRDDGSQWQDAALTLKATDSLQNSNDAAATTTSGTYAKVKENTLVAGRGELRIKFSLRTTNLAVTASGRIYKNGVAIGTERTTNSTSAVEFSEDIAGWIEGDLIQIYAKSGDGSTTVEVTNFRIYTDILAFS